MSYLEFDKEQLINLEFSLHKEILRSNRAGSYICTTVNGCNTRKYHGLLVCPIENFGFEKHILLSSLDETIVQNKAEFNLGIHRYQGGTYEPRGHKYIRKVELNRLSKITYRVGGVVLTKERVLVGKEEQILIRYTLEDANSPIVLRLKPFLAFRNIHQLSKANMDVNRKFKQAKNGISTKLYSGYPNLFMQISKTPDFVPAPDWYYNIEYLKELNRGYDYLEDLFVPGYFEFPMKKGESIVFAAGTSEAKPVSLKQRFTKELKKRLGRTTFSQALQNAAEQFIHHKKNAIDLIAGYPWYGSITRQTFVSLPGLDVALNNPKLYKTILLNYAKHQEGGLFPDQINTQNPVYSSADNSLWFIWTIQQFFKKYQKPKEIWKLFGNTIKEILEAYRSATPDFISFTKDGLIHSQKENTPLTWMNSTVKGIPIVERSGLAVEVNALWFNALCFSLDLADMVNDEGFINKWKEQVKITGEAFNRTFWNPGHEHLADVVNNSQDWSVRPNMVIAVAMDYTPLSLEQQKLVLGVAKKHLLTNRGLRTLSPDHIRYKGIVSGGPDQREQAMHQGTVWPWLTQFFVEGYLKIHKRGGLPFVKQIMESFEEEIGEHCIGTMSESYNGNPPHQAKGAISQAWSVAGVLMSMKKMEDYKE